MIDDEVIRTARRALLKRARFIRHVEFGGVVERQFSANQIRSGAAAKDVKPWLEDSLGNVVTYPVIYSFSVENFEIMKIIESAFDALQNDKERGFRIPKRNLEHTGTTMLYVGGSESIRRRLKEHIGEAPAGTYGLNMQRWCPVFDGIITIKVQSISPSVSRECRQDIEDALWDSMQPVFGKRGAR